MDVKLFSGTRNASSWAMRAWLPLRAAGIAFEEEVVDIRRPQRFHNLGLVARLSPPGQVPVLMVDDRIIFDSAAIMEFANDCAGGGLLPANAIERAEARSIVAWQHGGLSGICARISFESAFYPQRRALTSSEQTESGRLFDWLERLLERSDGPFLFGPVSLADFALTPTVIRLTRHQVVVGSWPRSAAWTRAVLGHRNVVEWIEEADRLPHIWYDEYLLPGEPFEAMSGNGGQPDGFVTAH